MKRFIAYVMLLLFIIVSTNAKAESLNDHLTQKDKHHRKVQQVIGLLHAAGMTSPLVGETAQYVEGNINGDYFYFSQNKHENLNFGLRHEVGSARADKLEIYLQADDSNYIYTASPDAAMVHYHIDISW